VFQSARISHHVLSNLFQVRSPYEHLNGKTGKILPIEGRENTRLARHSDNKYMVEIKKKNGKIQVYKLKRKYFKLIVHAPEKTEIDMRYKRMLRKEIVSAIESDDEQRIRENLEHVQVTFDPPNIVDCLVDLSGTSVLYDAISLGKKAAVDLLLEYKADVNRLVFTVCRDLATPCLILAISELLNEKKDPEKQRERLDIVVKLIQAGADVNVPFESAPSVLLFALSVASSRKFEDYEFLLRLIDALLHHGADPNVNEPNVPMSPLAFVCCINYFGAEEKRHYVIKRLMDHGADPGILYETSPGTFQTVFHYIVMVRLWEALELLLQYEKGRAAIHTASDSGAVPLFYAGK
jgi:ankyrin repeat protein